VTAASGDEQTYSSKTRTSQPITNPNDILNASDDTSVIEPEVFNQLKDGKLKPASAYVCM